MTTVKESFVHCRKVARRRARNFYYSFLLLPREQTQAMCAIYAFMRHCDDISDGPGLSLNARQAKLSRWKEALRSALRGQYSDDAILPAFHHTVQKFRIPAEYFFELIEGVGSDLLTTRYATFEDLYRYCYRVASVVGMTSVHVFGYESPDALRLAEKMGAAFQLTNILRDIPEDARLGRVYLPEEDLRRFGMCADDLLEGRLGNRFEELMEFEWTRASRYYDEAAPLLGMVSAQSSPALWAMVAIYRGILSRIRSLGYDVYRRRANLRGIEKAWIVAQALRMRVLGGTPATLPA